MLVFCTNCSAGKEVFPGLIPAVKRYKSARISAVSEAAALFGVEFFILSGQYGLISSLTPIPYYDHLLLSEELEAATDLVVGQIKNNGITEIVYCSISVQSDFRLEPYIACIESACLKAKVNLKMLEIKLKD